jgi:hypothetical protein
MAGFWDVCLSVGVIQCCNSIDKLKLDNQSAAYFGAVFIG